MTVHIAIIHYWYNWSSYFTGRTVWRWLWCRFDLLTRIKSVVSLHESVWWKLVVEVWHWILSAEFWKILSPRGPKISVHYLRHAFGLYHAKLYLINDNFQYFEEDKLFFGTYLLSFDHYQLAHDCLTHVIWRIDDALDIYQMIILKLIETKYIKYSSWIRRWRCKFLIEKHSFIKPFVD